MTTAGIARSLGMRRTALGLLVALAAVAGVTPGGARAQAPAPLTVPVAAGWTDRQVGVASNDRGDVAFVWTDQGVDGRTRLLSSVRPAAGNWTEPRVLAQGAGPGDAPLQPEQLSVAVTPSGAAHVLWASVPEDWSGSQPPSALRVSSWSSQGGWASDAVLAESTATAKVGAAADLVASADGTVVAAWSVSPPGQDESNPAGTAYTAERGAEGGWSTPVSLGAASGINADVQLAANAPGAVAAVWTRGLKDEYEGSGYVVSAIRTAPGAWAAGATSAKLEGVHLNSAGPRLDQAGGLHVLLSAFGNYGLDGLGHLQLGPGTQVSKETAVPRASKRQTLSDWLGAGYVRSAESAVAADGSLVVVLGREGLDVESGGFGVGGLYAATRSPLGAWSVVAIDALQESTGTAEVDLSTEPGGALVAVWSTTRDTGGCESLVYRSVRQPDGSWSPRAAAAVVPATMTKRACTAAAAHSTGGGQPLVWSVSGNQLRVAPPLAANAGAGSAWSAELATPTWRAVRAAGGLALRCTGPDGSTCSASLIRAWSKPVRRTRAAKRTRSALGCLALRAGGLASPSGGGVTLPLRESCRYGRVPPTASLSLVATLDAPGQTPVAKRLTVQIRR